MKRYTQREKDEALKLADEIGARQAAEQQGVSYASLLNWRKEINATLKSEDILDADVQPDASESIDENEGSCENHALPHEIQIHLLRQEIAHLKAECVRQAKAIHALTPIEE